MRPARTVDPATDIACGCITSSVYSDGMNRLTPAIIAAAVKLASTFSTAMPAMVEMRRSCPCSVEARASRSSYDEMETTERIGEEGKP